jgi:GH15 family glucan-1,4-alpha-glucosidase
MTILLVPGEKIFPEKELTHLDGHKGSKPVRIGNGAIDHIQLVRTNHNMFDKADIANLQDIYGELCDEPLSPLVVEITNSSLGWIVSILPKR